MSGGPANSAGVRFVFSSDSMPAGLSREKKAFLWMEAISNAAIKQDIDCQNRDEFFGHCETVGAGTSVVTLAHANSVRLSRKKKHIAHDNNDSLLLLVRDNGGAVGGSQFGRDFSLKIGETAIVDCKEQAETYGRDGGTALGVYIPRTALAGIDIEAKAARPLNIQSSESLRLLSGYAKTLLAGSVIDAPPLAALVSAHFGDLLAIALGGNPDILHVAKSRGLRAMRLAALRQAIATNVRRGDLTAESLGKMMGLSPRYIQHLLHQDGTTLTDELTARRLDLAFRALSNPAQLAQSTSDIAFQCGFGDLSTFYRAFKKRYGMTPGRIRGQ